MPNASSDSSNPFREALDLSDDELRSWLREYLKEGDPTPSVPGSIRAQRTPVGYLVEWSSEMETEEIKRFGDAALRLLQHGCSTGYLHPYNIEESNKERRAKYLGQLLSLLESAPTNHTIDSVTTLNGLRLDSTFKEWPSSEEDRFRDILLALANQILDLDGGENQRWFEVGESEIRRGEYPVEGFYILARADIRRAITGYFKQTVERLSNQKSALVELLYDVAYHMDDDEEAWGLFANELSRADIEVQEKLRRLTSAVIEQAWPSELDRGTRQKIESIIRNEVVVPARQVLGLDISDKEALVDSVKLFDRYGLGVVDRLCVGSRHGSEQLLGRPHLIGESCCHRRSAPFPPPSGPSV